MASPCSLFDTAGVELYFARRALARVDRPFDRSAETSMATRIFIDGEAGTTGLQIREKLAEIEGVTLVSLPAEARKDVEAKREVLGKIDVTILCLPDEAAKEAAALIEGLGPDGPRVIDASSAHRVAPGWVFGFPELSREQAKLVAAARKVTNPGCHATGAIAILRPLTDAGLLPKDFGVTIASVSGYSGGGKSMISAYEQDRAPPFELYGLALEHKHVPEIEKHSGLTRRPVFVPSVGDFRQGMLVSVPLHLDALPVRPSGADLRAALAEHYRGSRHVKVANEAESAAQLRLEPESLNGTNDMQILVYANEPRRQAVIVAKLDNLGKGASGAAVQNLALMTGLAVA
jgi:N-acetyl-gamma-glutamyl-phosphate reductase